MQKIIIDEEFELYLPPLDSVTYGDLEQTMLTYGCRVPLTLWNGILIDGHNRYSIITKHGLPFETTSMEFESRDHVLDWMIENQVAQRNLTPLQLSFFRGVRYNTNKRIVTNKQGINQHNVVDAQNGHQPRNPSTAERLAQQYNVSRNTIRRDAQVADAIVAIGKDSPDTKRSILSGETKITRKQLKELAAGTEDDVTRIIEQIQDGTFEGGRRPSSTSVGSTADGGTSSAGMQPWEIEFGKMTDEFRNVLRTHAKTDDTASVRNALRSYITMLEDLYKQI
ncbi:MAG: HTH domain-containing protein [Oscillospiraceae bacterium]|nr:HTH domain-containing protein [Oscillospiraceae bacterium]